MHVAKINLEADEMAREADAGPLKVYPLLWHSTPNATTTNIRPSTSAVQERWKARTEVYRLHQHC